MKLEKNSNASPANTNTKPATIKIGNTSAEALKPKKVLSKKNNLDDDEKLKKEAGNQQTEASEGNQTTSNSEDAAISNGDKVAAADTTATDATAGAGKSSSTPTAGTASGINNYALAGLIGLGAIGVAAAASSGGGGDGHSNPSGPAPDTTAPTLSAASRSSSAQSIALTFSENLDHANLPASSAFTISLNGNPLFSPIPMGSTIAIGAANQLVITLPLGTFTAGDTIAIRYTDPSAGNDSNALQDAAGNDVANFTTTSFSVIDGYVRNAKIYIDANGNGAAENSEYTGVDTDENGNFFLPTNRPAGSIIATGGVNIDTGIANTIEFKAPGNSSVLTPLTTLIQAYIAANNVDAANAENAIKTALGIPANIDLLNYDPLAEAPGNADALAVQKIAASIATIITLAAGADNLLENTVIQNLVTEIKDANTNTSTVDFTDSNTLSSIVNNTGTNTQTVVDATTAIKNANSLDGISNAQSDALDNISPATPTLLTLSDNSDTGVKGDNITNISNATIRVSFNTSATDGTAAVENDNITIYNGSSPVGATNLTAGDITNGYADISVTLAPGNNALTAQTTDAVFHKSAFSTATIFVLDTTAPNTPTISLVADSTDGAVGHNNDNITKNTNLNVSAAAAGEIRTYSINNGAATSGYVAPITDGAYIISVTDTDVAGNTASASIAFTRDTTIESPLVLLTNNSGNATDNITNDASLTFSAVAADVTRTYSINNGIATSSYTAPTTDGAYTVVVTDTDVAGNSANASLTFTLDTTIATPTVALTTDSGNTTDNITNDVSLTFSAAALDVTRTYSINNATATSSYIAPIADGTYNVLVTDTDTAGNSASASLTFTRDTSNSSPTIALSIDSTDGTAGHNTDNVTNNASLTFSATAADVTRTYSINNGASSSSYSAPTNDGIYTVAVIDTDIAGNTSSASITFTLDTVAAAPVWTNATGGILASDGVLYTGDSTPAIGGTAEAGTKINVYNALASASLAEGALLGSVTAGADGKWSLQLPQLSDGDYRAKAEAVDAAGNVSSLILGPLLTVDTSIATPTVALVEDSTNGLAGHDTDNITNNANLTFSTVAADVTRTYSINSGGAVFSSYSGPTTDGVYTVAVIDTDIAGNTSSANITFTLDTVATAPVWTNATGGILGSDGILNTNDSTPAIGGTAEAGATIHVYNALGSANLPEGALLGTVIAGADGKWSLQLPQLPDGDYRAKAEAVDAAGNVSSLATGPLLRVNTTNNSTDTAEPFVVSASFTEGANATITLTYNEPVKANGSWSPIWLNKLDPVTGEISSYPINITAYNILDNTITISTSTTLTSNDIIRVVDYISGDMSDLAGNIPLPYTKVIGGSGDNQINTLFYESHHIFAGNGADVIRVGDQQDIVNLTETIKSSDSVVVSGYYQNSTWDLMDNIIGFDVFGITTNDKLDLSSSTIVGNTTGFVNGVDAGSIKSHNVTNGILTFGSTDNGTAIVINETNRADVITYLNNNFTSQGLAVGFEIDSDSNGSADSLIIYQQQGDYVEDIAIMLSGLTGVTLGNTATNNVVQITDSQGPILTTYPVINNNTITFIFNEAISSYDLTGLSFKRGNGQTLTDALVTATNININSVTLTTNVIFGANDYVLMADIDKTHQHVTDNKANTSDVFYTYEGFSHAIGGAGDTIIDLSAITYTNELIDLTITDIAGGKDTLISGAGFWYHLDGGIGNDILDARLSANADLFGGDGNDVLYGAQFSNEFTGGKGADKITGSLDTQSQNFFIFGQGDSTDVTFADQSTAGLGNGDTFSFSGGADIILGGLNAAKYVTDQTTGQTSLITDSLVEFYSISAQDLLHMAAIPQDGLATDQGFFFQKGSYAEANGLFTVNDNGVDTLIVYDGDATAGVSQTALVLANVNAADLMTTSWGSIYLDPPPMG